MLGRSDGYSSGNFTSHNYYHADGNGNITYLVNSSQTLAASYRYDPYGNTTASSGTLAGANVYRFSSKELVANVGYYYGYRFYDPNLQRWLNRDPLGDISVNYLPSINPQSKRNGTGEIEEFKSKKSKGQFKTLIQALSSVPKPFDKEKAHIGQ